MSSGASLARPGPGGSGGGTGSSLWPLLPLSPLINLTFKPSRAPQHLGALRSSRTGAAGIPGGRGGCGWIQAEEAAGLQHPPPKLCFVRKEWDGPVGCSSCLWEGGNDFRAGSSKDFVKIDSKQVNSGLVEPALHPSVALHGGHSTQISASQSCDPSPDWDGLGRSPCPALPTEAGAVFTALATTKASPSLSTAWPRLKLFLSR